MKIYAADTEITVLEERVKRMVADAENEERETKETLLARWVGYCHIWAI